MTYSSPRGSVTEPRASASGYRIRHRADLQIYLAIGIETVVILIGILTNAAQPNSLNARIGALGTGFDARFTAVGTSLVTRSCALESRFDKLEAKIDALTVRVTDLNNRLARIEAKLDAR